jgi:hypothetical protein
MSASIKRGKATRADLAPWDGKTATYTRSDASGGTVTGLAVGNEVDVLQVYGSGTNRTRSTVNNAIQQIGSTSVTLVFAPGTWTIDASLTIPSNFCCHIPTGCVFDISAGQTLTFSGPLIRESETWYSGSGTVAYSPSNNVLLHTREFWSQTSSGRTAAEVSAGVTPLNYFFPPGYLLRYLASFTSGVTDCTTGLQNMLAVMRVSPGIVGVLPGGIALFASTLAIDTAGMTLIGQSEVTSILKKNGNFVGLTVTAANTIRDLTLDRTGADSSSGVTVRSQARCYWRNFIVQNQGSHGIWLQQTSISTFENIQAISNGGDGLRLDATVAPITANSYVNANIFINIDTRGNAGIGFNCVQCVSNFAIGIVAQNNTGVGVKLDDASGNIFQVYGEANNVLADIELTSAVTCAGNTLEIVNGGLLNSSTGDKNLIRRANPGGGMSVLYAVLRSTKIVSPERGDDGNDYQGTLALTHIANRDFALTADGFSGSQILRLRNAQSGGLDVITDRVELDTLKLKAVAPTVAASQVGIGSTTASTVGAAGGAAALPANPTGYWIINVAGTAFKVPYYAS